MFHKWRDIPCLPWRLSALENNLYCKESLGSKPLVNKHIPQHFNLVNCIMWPHSLGRDSATARLLGLWERIPPRAWLSVPLNVVCCQVQVSVRGRLLGQRNSTDCRVSECDKVLTLIKH